MVLHVRRSAIGFKFWKIEKGIEPTPVGCGWWLADGVGGGRAVGRSGGRAVDLIADRPVDLIADRPVDLVADRLAQSMGSG